MRYQSERYKPKKNLSNQSNKHNLPDEPVRCTLTNDWSHHRIVLKVLATLWPLQHMRDESVHSHRTKEAIIGRCIELLTDIS